MTTYTVVLSEAEEKALAFVALDPNEWIQNAVHERCRIAIDEIAQIEVQRRLSNGETISGTKEDLVIQSPLQSAAERHALFEEELKKLQEQQG